MVKPAATKNSRIDHFDQVRHGNNQDLVLDCLWDAPEKLGYLQMNGREVYKFAVTTFGRLIEETLEKAGIQASDVDQFVCHQSNARILESARTKFGIPESKLHVNIDRYGNCSGGSVPVVLDELRKSGKCQEGEIVLFVAFGGGLTWASSLWRI